MFYYEQSFPYAYAPAWSYDFACRCFHTLRVRLLEDDAKRRQRQFRLRHKPTRLGSPPRPRSGLRTSMKNGISFWYPEGWGKFYYTAVCQMNFEWSRGDEYHRDSWPEQDFILLDQARRIRYSLPPGCKNNEQYLIGFSGLGREPVYAHVKPKSAAHKNRR